MNKRILLIITIAALLFLALLFKMQSTQPTLTPAAPAIPIVPAVSAPTPTKTPVVVLPTANPVQMATPAIPTPAPPANTTTVTSSAVPNPTTQKALRQIGRSYQVYASEGGGRILTAGSGDTAHFVAQMLAQTGLTDASVYFVPGDPKAPNPPPTLVTDPAFANATLSVEIAANISFDTDVTTTPIAWTRGLREDGTWAPDSPFGDKGGYLVYADGHVEWYDKISVNDPNGGYFMKHGTNTPTANIREALPPGAVILSAEPNGAQK